MWNKIQRIYIGENQVYPVYRYSYDFRGKTTSQATADGRTLGSGVSIDANWLYASTWSNTLKTITGKSTNAKKITLICGLYNADTSNIDYSIWQATSWTVNSTWIYLGGQESTEVMTRRLLWTNTTYSFSIPSWAIEWTFILDLENLTWNTKIGTDVRSGSITQAYANSLKANSNYLRIAYQYWSWRVQYVKFMVEY